MLSTLDAALCGMTNLWQKTAAALYLWHADTNFPWFVGRLYLLRRGMSGVDSPIEKKQSNLGVDRRPSTPSVLSSAGKLIRYLHGPTSCLIVLQTFSSFVFFILHLYLFYRSANARHCALNFFSSTSWVDTPLTANWLQVCFGFRPRLSFLKRFFFYYIPHL